jgi:WD40 repeat protein
MKTHQVILGSANLNNHSLSWVKYLGTEYMAYASENNVIINSLTSFIQILHGHKEPITCIAWCASLGKLISCSKGRIIIYQPEEANFNLSQVFIFILNFRFHLPFK